MNTHEALETKQTDYAAAIDAITSRPLQPEIIDTYADNALQDLIDVVHDVEKDYATQTMASHENARETETAAFEYFGLGSIEEKLDHIADKAAELHDIDRIIQTMPKVSGVILPPAEGQLRTGSGSGDFAPKQIIPRTKTTLFVLANAFGVDLNDPEQFSIRGGELRTDMVRKTSYNIIQVPGLGRTILVCDEEDNATFIFDHAKLKELGIDPSDVLDLQKPEINHYIAAHPSLGRKLRYNNVFVEKMAQLLDKPIASSDTNHNQHAANLRFLDPTVKISKAPEGYLSLTGAAKQLGVATTTIEKVLATMGDEYLADIKYYVFGPNKVRGFSPEQFEALVEQVNTTTEHLLPEAPEGYSSIKAMEPVFGINKATIKKYIQQIDPELLGEVSSYKVNGRPVQVYSPEQQQIIRSFFEEQDVLAKQAPEGYASLKQIVEASELDYETVKRVVETIDPEQLGAVEKHKFNTVTTTSYSPEQQAIIRSYLDAKGYFADKAPEGYVSLYDMAKENKVGYGVLQKYIDEIDPEALGTIEKYKFDKVPIAGFSPEQQQIIRRKLESAGLAVDMRPEGYLSIAGLAKALGIATGAVQTALAGVPPEELGAVHEYRFSTKTVPGFSPAQQGVLRTFMEKSGVVAPAPPEGYVSANMLRKELGTTLVTINKVIAKIDPGELGATGTYKFGANTTTAYSPEQQAIIRAALENR